ncbi:hypothetical protein MMC22_000409 [Lobaria immixta]|nr:hypothetical protein [Lobaria immixta]
MLKIVLCGVVSLASLVSGAIIPRADPPFQFIPATSKPDNTYHNGNVGITGEPPVVTDIPPAVYGARSVDLPFGRLYHGKMKYFKKGQLNTPNGMVDEWHPGVNDFANQSACGIPDNAFSPSKVAIHPYFLKYADLSRYCMQDVCISFWKEDGSSDMILKVTDICDPADCETPADIKLIRNKVQVMQKLTGTPLWSQPALTGDEYPEKTWWFFTKCWADALAQPAYQGPPANNWFTTPYLPNNIKWAQSTVLQQWKNNQVAYKARGWPTYPQGAYNTHRDDTTSPPITDWVPGQEPDWTPIAGGKGWGKPNGDYEGATPSSQAKNVGPEVPSTAPAESVISEAPPKPVSAPPEQSSQVIPETTTQQQQPVEQPTQQSEYDSVVMPTTASTPAPSLSILKVLPTLEIDLKEDLHSKPSNSLFSKLTLTTAPSAILEATSATPTYQATPTAPPPHVEPAQEDDDTCEA